MLLVLLFSAGARPPAGEAVAADEPHSFPNPILANEDTGTDIHVMALANISV